MGTSPRRRRRGAGKKTSSDAAGEPGDVSDAYQARTIGYEDVLYSHGTTKAAALFEKVNTKLARYVSMQSWTGATVAGRAMERMAEPEIVKPVPLPLT